jgi:serine/threonine-protein kinase ULK2
MTSGRDRSPLRAPILLGSVRDGGIRDADSGSEFVKDPLEDDLLVELEELAQKTDVLTRWADEMYEFVKAVPRSTFDPF